MSSSPPCEAAAIAYAAAEQEELQLQNEARKRLSVREFEVFLTLDALDVELTVLGTRLATISWSKLMLGKM